MTRREFVAGVTGAIAAAGVPIRAQQQLNIGIGSYT
jgi:hypothetical protein